MKRILASIILYCGAALGAFIVAGLLHILSKRGLWGIFDDADRVRQLSVYLLDTIPFFIAAFTVGTAASHFAARGRVVWHGKPWLLALTAVAGAIAMHTWFFATDGRGIVFLNLFALIFACLYSIGGWLLFGWFRPLRSFIGFPAPGHAGSALLSLIVICVGYVGAFASGVIPGYQPETETYRWELEPTSPALIYSAMTSDPLGARLFTREELSVPGGQMRFADMDGDGRSDIVLRRSNGVLELWRNDRGRFVQVPDFLAGVRNSDIGDYYIADYDGDGRNDIALVYMVQPQPSEFHNTFVKKLFWYFGNDPSGYLALLRQLPSGQWQDVTQDAFPGGQPEIFQKIEPVLWFDANNDGRLDFVFSQYPNGRHSLNKLYVQDAQGRFHDRMKDLLSGAAPLIYSEGSDVADFDGDGDIDFFAFGYLFRHTGGTYRAMCGRELEGIPCNAYGRLDEAGLFEDVDGDGTIDLVMSYHGPGSRVPKYYLQIYRGDSNNPGRLTRDERHGGLYYGMHTHARAKDFNLNGLPDILTEAPSRLLSLTSDGQWLDLMPAISGSPSGSLLTGGWIDIDDDGDWDIVMALPDGKSFLLRNQLNPTNVLKISALGEGMIENQPGTTVRIHANATTLVQSYRPMSGYAGTSDPRIVTQFEPNLTYAISACFPSLSGRPAYQSQADGVALEIKSVSGSCVEYELTIASGIDRVDLTLIAGSSGASLRVTR